MCGGTFENRADVYLREFSTTKLDDVDVIKT